MLTPRTCGQALAAGRGRAFPLHSVAASKSVKASQWHRWMLGNPMVQMDMEQPDGVDGCGASPWQGRTRGKPTAQVDIKHPLGTDGQGIPIAQPDLGTPKAQTQGIPMAQLDMGHPRGPGGCRTSNTTWMQHGASRCGAFPQWGWMHKEDTGFLIHI